MRPQNRGVSHRRAATTLSLLAFIMAACSGNENRADAYGNFEATEILVSAQAAGTLTSFRITEGTTALMHDTVGLIDTVQLSLQRLQLAAQRKAVRSRTASVAAQIAVLEEQRRIAYVERQRIYNLLKDQAATGKQRDDIDGQIAVIDRQVEQARTQLTSINAEIDALSAQIAQVDDHIRRAVIVNPVSGTVLTKFVEEHELVSVGSPLYKVADLSTMELRAYLSGSQLPHIRIGQHVEVQIDESRSENQSLNGEISWISSEAEFTPKLIQTKEERVNLVYAFKVQVDNPDGTLKVGMPGEVWLTDTVAKDR